MMRYIFFISTFFLCGIAFAAPKKYYISTGGNNSNSGTSSTQPWASIDKVNSSMSLFVAGDSILFRSGDTFAGSIIFTKSGTNALPIVIGAYGTGAKPIISGLTTLTGWSSVGANLWECTPVVTLKKNCNVLTINGVPQAVGRTDWITYQSATSSTITSSSLTGTPNYTGAEVIIRKNTFITEKLTITSQSGTVLTTANNTQPISNGSNATSQPGKSGNGFFIQRWASTLDKQGEWYFNASTNKMRLFSTVNPAGLVIKASYVDTVIKLAGMNSIIISGLSIEGAGLYGIESYGASDVQVRNCDFNNNTKAVYMWNTNDALMDGNVLWNSFNGGLFVSNNQTKRISMTNNSVHNTGQLIGLSVFNTDYSMRGIVARTGPDPVQNFVNIVGNTVKNSGNAGIHFQGSNVIVERNIIDSFANVVDDNGGIYTFIANANKNTVLYYNRVVRDNFISNAIGAPLGSSGGNIDVVGLYLDDQTCNVKCEGNTIYNVPGVGIQMNNSLNDTIINNTVYNTDFALNVNVKQYGSVTGNVVKGNNFYPISATQFIVRYTNSGLNNTGQTISQALASFAYMDSNFVRMKLNAGFDWYYATTQGGAYTFPADMNISQWRNSTGHDIKSLEADVSKGIILANNASSSLLNYKFNGFSKKDPKLNVYNDAAVLSLWTSLLLIDNGNSVPPVQNQAPTASAGTDTSIVLPGGMVYLRGNAIDKDGTIASYKWQLISTPIAGTITNPNSKVTTVTDLVKGVYQYRLTVTDDDGATATSTVNVTVLPDIQPTNFLILHGTKIRN